MKTNKIVWVTSVIGIGIILCCWLLSLILPLYGKDVAFGQLFNWVCTLLGFAANLTIVAAAVKFLTKETLDIEGYGKIRISRMQNNIQDLTNLISRDFHGGEQFSRDSLLKAFYKNIELDYIEKYRSESQPEENNTGQTWCFYPKNNVQYLLNKK